jgi:hypothetical protein
LINPKRRFTLAANQPVESKTIRLWAILTLIFFCAAVGSFSIREIVRLQEENKRLQDSRMHLIKSLKSSNQEICSLKNSGKNSDPLQAITISTGVADKKPSVKVNSPKNFFLPTTSSISFNATGRTIFFTLKNLKLKKLVRPDVTKKRGICKTTDPPAHTKARFS